MGKSIKKKESKQLKLALKGAGLTKDEHKRAWAIMRDEGLDAALAFVGAERKTIDLSKAVPYNIWGREHIDKASIDQMDNAARLPVAVKGALMPDAHVGYGLPIGGVLATENAVIPYAVGVDIACRMRMTIFDADAAFLKRYNEMLKHELLKQTRFGAGAEFERNNLSNHPILDDPDWDATKMLDHLYDTAVVQLGTSGGGNHFVEWGLFTLDKPDTVLGIDEPGEYLALLSHSGSRAVGYKIANHYSRLARELHPELPDKVKHLAWLSLDTEEGQEYWLSMELAGRFAAANHAVIHKRIAKATGLQALTVVENHHNFAWKERVDDKEVIVHRKGATPAGHDVLGIIPGSMGDPGYVVRGKGNEDALNSAAHGAGRKMSRKAAKRSFNRRQMVDYLAERGIELLGGGLDEAPMAYKAIGDVIAAQDDLIVVVGRFIPKIVRMAND